MPSATATWRSGRRRSTAGPGARHRANAVVPRRTGNRGLARADRTAGPALTDVLVAGGELTWRAGPLAKGPGLCHGTAGNGYAFLKLFERTGDEVWLDRARAFAMHAAEQVERSAASTAVAATRSGPATPGTALFLSSCLTASAGVPTLDRC